MVNGSSQFPNERTNDKPLASNNKQRSVNNLRYQVRCPGLPLAVYREVAAHLRQVEGVEVSLIPETSQQFDYSQSQVGGLWIQHSPEADGNREQVEQILAYYSDRYRPWEKDDLQT